VPDDLIATLGFGGGPPTRRRSWLTAVDDHRYLLLALVVVALMLSATLKQKLGMGVDFWEHAAAVRELALHPLHPQHPFFGGSGAHQFLNPYALGLALVSRSTGMGVATVLELGGMVNLALVLVGLRLFVSRVSTHRHTDFWSLLFVLVLWGPGAWFFSGFLNFDVLSVVLPYPSTFAKGLVLIGLWAFDRFLADRREYLVLGVFVIAVVVVLSHPIEAAFLYVGLVAFALGRRGPRADRDVALAVGVSLASFLAAQAWPYFSLYQLLFGGGQVAVYRTAIDAANHDMYVHVIGRTLPLLLVVPFYLRRLWCDWRDPLALVLSGLLAIYVYGEWTQSWSFGRVISAAVVVAAVMLADERAAAAEAARRLGRGGKPARWWLQVTTVGLLAFGAFNVRNGFNVVPDAVASSLAYSWAHPEVDLAKVSDFDLLSRHIARSDVVMSDLYTSLSVPAFSGHPVAVARTMAFIDASQRGADVGRFYNVATSPEERRAIVSRYGVRYLLIARSEAVSQPSVYGPLLAMGPTVASNHRFTLVDLRATPPPAIP